MEPEPRITDRLGLIGGWLVAPVFGLVSRARRARTFHPRGPVYHGRAVRHASTPLALYSLAERLSGDVLVRFSGALWKKERRFLPEVLGCALRFRDLQSDSPLPSERDQDLLFATIRRPWTMPLSPLTTHAHDYLANDYFAVSPFDSQEVTQPFYLRLHPTLRASPPPTAASTRAARLSSALRDGAVVFDLEHSTSPFGPWHAVARVQLDREANIDGESLRFQPYRNGRGIRPHGFVHALRRGVYAVSQQSRPRQTHADAGTNARDAVS